MPPTQSVEEIDAVLYLQTRILSDKNSTRDERCAAKIKIDELLDQRNEIK